MTYKCKYITELRIHNDKKGITYKGIDIIYSEGDKQGMVKYSKRENSKIYGYKNPQQILNVIDKYY